MTAKEALRHMVDDLSEEEAGAWLERMSNGGGKSRLTTFERAMKQDIVRGKTDPDALLALFEQWRAEGPVMTEEEWDEFARAVDIGRPHRPLFS